MTFLGHLAVANEIINLFALGFIKKVSLLPSVVPQS